MTSVLTYDGLVLLDFAAPSETATMAIVEARPADQRYRGHMDWGGAGWWVMFSLMAVFWIAVLVIAAWAVSIFARRSPGQAHGPSPLDIAKQRYARGEITAEEFERLKRDLA
jgi:putative membrane protein